MYLLIADDFTGANDTGIQFAKCGIHSRLALSAEGADIGGAGQGCLLAVNANTRDKPPKQAGECLTAFIARFRAAVPRRPAMLFHKIDSTMRGNPGREMDVIMNGLGIELSFLAPSFPKQGRTVADGKLLVNGTPVHETVFANDPLAPVRESAVASLIGKQSRRKTGLVPQSVVSAGKDDAAARVAELAAEGAECIAFDAATPEDLAVIAETGLGMRDRPLFIGSAGLAEAVARLLPKGAAGNAENRLPPAARVFFICGSANQATHEQTAALAEAGVPLIRMAENFLEDTSAAPAAVESVLAALNSGSAALAVPLGRIGEAGGMEKGKAVSAALSAMACDMLAKLGGDPASTALVMTGGETAFSVFERLGSGLNLHRELLPGIALCTVAGGPWDGLQVVTKAGGFGTRTAFTELLDMLRRSAA